MRKPPSCSEEFSNISLPDTINGIKYPSIFCERQVSPFARSSCFVLVKIFLDMHIRSCAFYDVIEESNLLDAAHRWRCS